MAQKVSLRVRLSFWYSTIVAVSLLVFGAYTYFSVSKQLRNNLDASLIKVANSLDFVITENSSLKGKPLNEKEISKKALDKLSLFKENERKKFIGPLRPGIEKDTDESKDFVWSAVYEHILLNPKNYFIQIADTNEVIIWRSKNLLQDSLPLLKDFVKVSSKDTISLKDIEQDSVIKLAYEKTEEIRIDSIFSNLNITGEDVRFLVKRTEHAIVSVAYTISDVQATLNQLFMIQLIALPVVLLISLLGGLILSKLSLKPIDQITKTADDITAKNLSLRLPEHDSKDEVGHLTRTLNRMIERLDNSFTQIKKFSSDASHELRTPLTILRGELELALYSEKTQEEYENVLISALEEVARLTNVVETLLDLSKAESGQIRMNLTKGSITKLLLDIAEDAEMLAESKGISVNFNIKEEVQMYFDGPRLHQAFLNVVDNAVKYTPTGGHVSIELKNGKQNVMVIISDTGMGIPEDEVDHIFDRLYRVDKARSSNIQGSGLGLSIVKWIIDSHDGKIHIKSELHKGTSFIIQLPKFLES